MSPSPHSSKSPLKFTILSMVTDTLTCKMDCCPSKCLSNKDDHQSVCQTKIKGTAHKISDIGGTCKRSFSSAIHKAAGLTVLGRSTGMTFHHSIPEAIYGGTAPGGCSCWRLFWEWPVKQQHFAGFLLAAFLGMAGKTTALCWVLV